MDNTPCNILAAVALVGQLAACGSTAEVTGRTGGGKSAGLEGTVGSGGTGGTLAGEWQIHGCYRRNCLTVPATMTIDRERGLRIAGSLWTDRERSFELQATGDTIRITEPGASLFSANGVTYNELTLQQVEAARGIGGVLAGAWAATEQEGWTGSLDQGEWQVQDGDDPTCVWRGVMTERSIIGQTFVATRPRSESGVHLGCRPGSFWAARVD